MEMDTTEYGTSHLRKVYRMLHGPSGVASMDEYINAILNGYMGLNPIQWDDPKKIMIKIWDILLDPLVVWTRYYRHVVSHIKREKAVKYISLPYDPISSSLMAVLRAATKFAIAYTSSVEGRKGTIAVGDLVRGTWVLGAKLNADVNLLNTGGTWGIAAALGWDPHETKKAESMMFRAVLGFNGPVETIGVTSKAGRLEEDIVDLEKAKAYYFFELGGSERTPGIQATGRFDTDMR